MPLTDVQIDVLERAFPPRADRWPMLAIKDLSYGLGSKVVSKNCQKCGSLWYDASERRIDVRHEFSRRWSRYHEDCIGESPGIRRRLKKAGLWEEFIAAGAPAEVVSNDGN